MEKLLQWMGYIEDVRQEKKVRHKLKDILVIVLFATLADADDWVEIAEFAEVYEDYLKKYIGLENGVPSHGLNGTIQRVMGMVLLEAMQQLYLKWQGLLDSGEGEALKKIVCIDGKKLCVGTKTEMKNHCILFLHGAKKTASAWGRGQSWKKAMKLQQYHFSLKQYI